MFKFLEIVNETYKIYLPSVPFNFRSTIVKLYLIGREDNDPNNTLKIKHNDQKNGHKENHPFIASLIAGNPISIVVIISPIAADLLINIFNNHHCKTMLFLLARENCN